jgi:hypothetical protein
LGLPSASPIVEPTADNLSLAGMFKELSVPDATGLPVARELAGANPLDAAGVLQQLSCIARADHRTGSSW